MREWNDGEAESDIEQVAHSSEYPYIVMHRILQQGIYLLNECGHEVIEKVELTCSKVWKQRLPKAPSMEQQAAHIDARSSMMWLLRDHARCLREMGS